MCHQPRARPQAGAFRIDPSEPMGWLHMPPPRAKPPLPGATGSSSHATGGAFFFSATPNIDVRQQTARMDRSQERATATQCRYCSHHLTRNCQALVPEPCFHITPARACNTPSRALTRLRLPVRFLGRSPLSTALTPDTSLPKPPVTQSHN